MEELTFSLKEVEFLINRLKLAVDMEYQAFLQLKETKEDAKNAYTKTVVW